MFYTDVCLFGAVLGDVYPVIMRCALGLMEALLWSNGCRCVCVVACM